MSRTLAGGARAGIRSGLGSASAHAVYAALAVAGVGRASSLFIGAASSLRMVGGLVLVGLGLRLGLTRSHPRQRSTSSAYATTLVLGLANPLTLLYFAAAVAVGAIPAGAGASVVAGVFVGSSVWWVTFAKMVAALRRHIDDRQLVWINRLAAAAVMGFGLLAVAAAL